MSVYTQWLLVLFAAEVVLLAIAVVGVRFGSEWSPRRHACTLLALVLSIAAVGTLAELASLWVVGNL